jgi:hypothetical protein
MDASCRPGVPEAPSVGAHGHTGSVDLSLALSAIATLISGAALYVSIKQPVWTQQLSVARVAADALIESVGSMRQALWASAEDRPDPEVVAKLAYDLDRTCRAHRRSLPRGLSGVGGDVRAAVSNYLGGASGYALDPSLKRWPFSGHERYWWEISTTYLDYVIDTLGEWRNNPRDRVLTLIPFHQWRRGEDEAYHRLWSRNADSAPALGVRTDDIPSGKSHEEPAAPQRS